MPRLMVGIGLMVTVLGWGLLVQADDEDGLPAGKTWAEGEQLAQTLREHPPGTVFRDCPECPEMVVVPPGRFRMGDLNGRGAIDESPVHDVTIACPFAVGKYEVTFAEWDACVAAGGCTHRPYYWRWGRDARPVRDVSWKDTQEYVAWLSRETGKSYRLLSEAEWEYVARAETTTEYWWGNEADHNYANYGKDERDVNYETDVIDLRQAAGKDRWLGTAPVGSFEPNAFGLFDTAGNVSEWVEDCDHDSYAGAPNDGSAWTSGACENRVWRGGSWQSSPRYLRSATRDGIMSGFPGNDDNIGFRIARTLD